MQALAQGSEGSEGTEGPLGKQKETPEVYRHEGQVQGHTPTQGGHRTRVTLEKWPLMMICSQ